MSLYLDTPGLHSPCKHIVPRPRVPQRCGAHYYPMPSNPYQKKKRWVRDNQMACRSLAPQDVWCILSASAAVGQVAQERTFIGQYVSGQLIALALGLCFAALGILPLSCHPYRTVYEGFLPLATALLLLEADLKRLLGGATDGLLAFLFACIGTLVGTVMAWLLLGARLGADGWKVAGALCGTYIGGSINFAAVSQALLMDPVLSAAAMAADNLVTALYLALISLIPDRKALVDQRLSVIIPETNGSADKVTAETIAVSLAGATAVCALSQRVATGLGSPSAAFAITAVLSSCLASICAHLLPPDARPFAGSQALGGAIMLLFFVVMGAEAGSVAALARAGWMAAFISLQLGFHIMFLLSVGRVFSLPLPLATWSAGMQVLLTASNAAVGGPATAAAMAAVRNWKQLVQAALLLGSLGYTVGTAVGCATGYALRNLPPGAVL